MPLKDIPYPETPSCDYLFDLARQVQDLNIVPDVKVIENKLEDPRKEMNEKQQEAFLVANTNLEVYHLKKLSKITIDLSDKYFQITGNQNMPEEFGVIPVERVIAELPGDVTLRALLRQFTNWRLAGFAVSSLKLMEAHLYACLQILKETNSPVIGDLLKESSTLAELDPKTTRLCLLKLQKEITKTKLDSGQDHNGKT